MIAADDDDDGVTKEVGGRREILSANLEEMMD
jgi:hypothetical protein